MTDEKQKQLGKTPWAIADRLRGAMDAVHAELVEVARAITEAKQRHNSFLKELGLKPLP